MRLKAGPIWRAAMLVLILTSCAAPGAFESPKTETASTICRELARDFPTWAEDDTPESLAAAARFTLVFEAVCPDAPL